ncbi:MAG: hypothetical protein WCS52_04615 [bacterium]
MKQLIRLTGGILTLLLITSCSTPILKSGTSSLAIHILPEPNNQWQTAKIFLNGQCVETAFPDDNLKTFDLAPGKYDVKIVTPGYQTCTESVSLIDGRKQQYIEFRPKKGRDESLNAAIDRFFSK